MNVIERIQDNFSKGFFGKSMQILELPKEWPAWTFKQDEWIGVAVPVDNYKPFSERFAHAKIMTEPSVEIDGISYDVLMLICTNMDLRNEFAVICSQFVEPGINGNLRNQLISSPERWWNQWRFLLGNSISNSEPYPILGELIMLEKQLLDGKNAKWTGIEKGTHDLEMNDCSIEVKSTANRYGYEVTISSIYQLLPAGKPLKLAFFRFEKSSLGRSIDDLMESLEHLGYSSFELENKLKEAGYEKGCTARNIRYKIIEAKQYNVDDNFPSVTELSFKNNKLPECITKFTYTVDLAGLHGIQIK